MPSLLFWKNKENEQKAKLYFKHLFELPSDKREEILNLAGTSFKTIMDLKNASTKDLIKLANSLKTAEEGPNNLIHNQKKATINPYSGNNLKL